MRIWNKLKVWFGADAEYQDLAGEMRLHLELRAEKLRQAGMSAEEADAAARKQFGNILLLHEDSRAAWGVRWFDNARQDTSYALRTLKKNKIFTAAAVLTLALGIAANTTLFAFVNALILRPLNIPNAGNLAAVTIHDWTEHTDMPALCYPVFEALAKRTHSLKGLFTWTETPLSVGWGTSATTVLGAAVSGNYYATLGAHPYIGRFLSPDDDTPSAPNTAVLSYSYWHSQYGGSRAVIGRTIRLDGQPFTIIGVEPPHFPAVQVASGPWITIPMHADARLNPKWNVLTQKNVWWLAVFGRLRPGVSLKAAEAELAAVTKPVMQSAGINLDEFDSGKGEDGKGQQRLGIMDASHGLRLMVSHYDRALYVLLCIALSVLCIGCLNIANLLLARSVAREREFGVRIALGAGRARVLHQLLTESVVISVGGAVLGLLLTLWATPHAARLMGLADVNIDWRVLVFVAAISTIVTLLCGLMPAVRAISLGAAALKSDRVGQAARSAQLSNIAVVTQVALSVALISGALVFVKTFQTLIALDPGFVRQKLVFCGINTDRSGFTPQQNAAFFREILEHLQHTPGVTAAAVSGIVPLTGNCAWSDLSRSLYPNLSATQRQLFTHRVSPGYFRTMGMRLFAGRDFTEADAHSAEEPVLISSKAAKLLFPKRNAVGETLIVEGAHVRIIGIVSDARYQSIREGSPQTLYYDIFHTDTNQGGVIPGSTFLMIRTPRSAAAIGSTVRNLVHGFGRDIVVDPAMSFDQQFESMLVTERVLAWLATCFAVLGCALAAVGLYGIVAYSVTRRTTEIGIRMALGATRGKVISRVLGGAARLIVFGLLAGIAIAVLGGRSIQTLLYSAKATDPVLILLTVAALVTVGALASIIPGARAARIDPMAALRRE